MKMVAAVLLFPAWWGTWVAQDAGGRRGGATVLAQEAGGRPAVVAVWRRYLRDFAPLLFKTTEPRK